MEQFIVRNGGEAPPVANRREIVVEKNSSENVSGEGETENTTKTVENPPQPPKQQKKKALPPEEADEHGRRRRSAADEVADARRVLAEATNGLGRIQEIGLDSGGRPFTPADYVLLVYDFILFNL
jgi:hypothetical protein